MAGEPMQRKSHERALTAATRSCAWRARSFGASSCICCVIVLFAITLMWAATATARPASLSVLVRASSSDRGDSATVKVAVQSAIGAKCRLTVDADKHSVSFPAIIGNTRGLLAIVWQVPADAPSGRWAFNVSCTNGRQSGQGSDHLAVLVGRQKNGGQLVANSSSQIVLGEPAAARIRVDRDSYASSCSADICFANDPLWRAAGESTWYAAGRRPDLDGIVDENAEDWMEEARGRVPEGVLPVVGAIAVWSADSGGASSRGHVAYVADVSGTRVLVEDSNWGQPSLRVHRHWIPATSISGYIYGGLVGADTSGTPSSPHFDSPPPSNAGVLGGSGSDNLAEGSTPEVLGTPEEPPSGSESNPPDNPLEATLPPAPTTPQPASLEIILPQARQIMSQTGTMWSKATAVRNLVRASLGDQNDCAVMAMAFWSVGSIVGLPLRVVDSSANGENAFDTHSTVEVWLAGLGRWAISDPTFNGYWTAGPEGAPVSAEYIQSAVRAGTNNMLYWHGADTPNSILPSQYYVDPTYLYRYIDFLSFVPSLGSAFMVNSQTEAFSAPNALVPTAPTDFESLPPNAQTPVTAYKRTETSSSAGVSDFTLPPSYAGALVYEGQVTVGSDGRVAIPLAEQSPATVVSVDSGSGHWQMEISGGTTYSLDAYPEARVSPIVFFTSPVYLVAGEVVSAPITVRVWTVKDFPSSREVTSQWDGG